ncbi:MAG TPA: hypothetical protein VIN08_20500 [Ohtaekwangia sp.]|uniref:hypothetical protein n=1 Tax=Ohtaekwangia sp. TaxID=2066019 RepID=UPI002F943592
MPKKDFSKLEKEALIELLLASQYTLEKKRHQLRRVREKLSSARKRMHKMKDIILYQRKRILERAGQDI